MGAGHGASSLHVSALHHHGDTAVHRLPAEVKIVATLVFVVAVVLTPGQAVWAFGIDALAVVGAMALARLPLRLVASRLRIELPFVAFAVFLPVVGADPRVEVAGLSLSEPGLWGAWTIVAKGTLGVGAAIVLSGTTPVAELLRGLERLRVPSVLVAIAGFMVRYLDILLGESQRMRIARLSRGDDPRWLWQARGVAATAGTLFVRSYERGERVHLAMLSRGFAGAMPLVHGHRAPTLAWLAAAAYPLVALAALAGALLR